MNKALRENLTQFIVAAAVGWLIMYLVPAKLFFQTYAPFSFLLLFWLLILGVNGRGWPITPPAGFWKPGMSKAGTGLLMTALWIVLALINAFVVTTIWPAIPLFPVGIYYGAMLFMTTLWYTFIWGAYPVANKSGAVNVVVGTIVIFVITSILWVTMINFQGMPFAQPSYPNGVFGADNLLGMVIWTIAWIMIFGNGLSMQSYPFYKLGQPLGQIVLTVAVVILGYLSWTFTTGVLNWSPPFSFGAVAGSIIGWVLFHSFVFGYYPNAKHIQPKRGLNNMIIVVIAVVIWIPLLKIILAPIVANLIAAGVPVPPFDISVVSMLYTLHVVAILAVMHSLFWFKMPFTPLGPPIGPEEIPPGINEISPPDIKKISL